MVYVIGILIALSSVCTVIVNGNEEKSSLDSAEINNPRYSVSIKKYKTNLLKQCRYEITVSGNDIWAVYSVPCSVYGLNVIATDQVLVVHNRDKRNPLILYSDSRSALIEVFEGKCSLNTFTTVDGKTTSTEEGMTKQACNDILNKIAQEEKKANNPLKETKRVIKLAFQRMFPPEFFEALKTDKPIYDDYSPGWNSWG